MKLTEDLPLMLLCSLQSTTGQVRISEFSAFNSSTLADEEGSQGDWVELVNLGSQTINLNSWNLTDDPQSLRKWTFPSVLLSPGKYLVIFASGKDRRASDISFNAECLVVESHLAPFIGSEPGDLNLTTGQNASLQADVEGSVVDSDGDTLPDAWELENGLDPQSHAGAHGADGDWDLDGATNREEYQSGTIPNDATSLY